MMDLKNQFNRRRTPKVVNLPNNFTYSEVSKNAINDDLLVEQDDIDPVNDGKYERALNFESNSSSLSSQEENNHLDLDLQDHKKPNIDLLLDRERKQIKEKYDKAKQCIPKDKNELGEYQLGECWAKLPKSDLDKHSDS